VLFYFYRMRKWLKLELDNADVFIDQLVNYSSNWKHFQLLDSHRNATSSHRYTSYQILAACDSVKSIEINDKSAFDSLKKFNNENNDWIFGHLNYDLKNCTEELTSGNKDAIEFPELFFFVPKYVVIITNSVLEIGYLTENTSDNQVRELFKIISTIHLQTENFKPEVKNIMHNFTENEYVKEVEKIQKHILQGNIYELNFCMEFLSKQAKIVPSKLYSRLSETSPAPFSGFYKLHDKYLLSSSPERFLAKRGNKLISQPIKGTIKRGENLEKDYELKKILEDDIKERAENIMIVDLVRNDLSRTAKKGSVKVEELCKIYSYKYVHQMISTVVAELDEDNFGVVEVIKNAFPMGSMTGAPKIKAMQLIEHFEKSKRGLYSGCIGYISPDKDFDFNVIIRSILYNSTKQYLSFSVGSAITFKSVPEKEYLECLLKAKAMKVVLQD